MKIKMNKIVKKVSIINIILLIITLLCTITNTLVYAQPTVPDVGTYEPQPEAIPEKATTLIGTIANVIQVIGIVFTVAVVIMIGIKYMTGSPEAKAEYKKVMIPYLVGAALIFGVGTILKVIDQLTSSAMENI